MLTDEEIQYLIDAPKKITSKHPTKGYTEENGHKRCYLELAGISADGKNFSIFINQNNTFQENFSIGLRYKTKDKAFGSVTLIRYNGSHGETRKNQDNHYHQPHIHRLTAIETKSGSTDPQEKHRKVTGKYNAFEDALTCFFEDIHVQNHFQFFPELRQTRLL